MTITTTNVLTPEQLKKILDSGLKNQDKILQILFPIIKLHF